MSFFFLPFCTDSFSDTAMLSSSEAFSPSTWDHRGTSFSSSLCHKDMQKGPTMESSTTPAESSNSGRTVAYQAAHESSSGSGSGSAGGGGGGGGGGGASSSQTPREPAAPRPKRTVVHVACTCCRRLRIKVCRRLQEQNTNGHLLTFDCPV
jgi:hypothetical protein